MQGSSAPSAIHVASLPFAQVAPVAFFLIFFVWAVFTIIAAYHWFRYSNNSTAALTMMSVHLIVSAWFAIYAVSGLMGIT